MSWSDWSAKDGQKDGNDPDGIMYIRPMINLLLARIPAEKRTGVFWTGGIRRTNNTFNIPAFIETELSGKGIIFYDYMESADLTAMKLDRKNKTSKFWRMVNRSSKGI